MCVKDIDLKDSKDLTTLLLGYYSNKWEKQINDLKKKVEELEKENDWLRDLIDVETLTTDEWKRLMGD
jgi:uncharacterized protein (DUF608 family)